MCKEEALTRFENEEFGNLRVVVRDGETYFVAHDIVSILGFRTTRDTLDRYVDSKDKFVIKRKHNTNLKINSNGLTIITKEGLHSLILLSKIAKVKEFEKWVYEEILPSFQKNKEDKLMDEDNFDLAAKVLILLKEERKKRKHLEIESKKSKIENARLIKFIEKNVEEKKQLEKKIKADKSKVELADIILETVSKVLKKKGFDAIMFKK